MKKLVLTSILLVLFLASSFAQTNKLKDFKDALNNFLNDINLSLPDSTVSGVTWSDAYIGQLVSVPPHFGAGLALGVSRFRVSGLKESLKLVGTDLSVDELVFPTIALEGRIGGFILPFDFGVRFGYLPKIEIQGIGVEYLHYGADIRYALLKQNILLPNISLALGYYGTSGNLSYQFTFKQLTGIKYPGITGKAEKLEIGFNTNVFDGRLQVSKSFVFVTPYAGFGLSFAMTDSSYELIKEKGNSQANEWQYRAFAGLSLNIAIVRFDLSGMYNFKSENWGANLGIRVQL